MNPVDYPAPEILWLGRVAYETTLERMQAFTASRDAHTPDQIWLCEHPPVFTLGVGGQMAHVLAPADIPLVRSNRGGQVTYHGPGQLVAYALFDLQRLGIFVKEYVFRLEQAVLRTLQTLELTGHRVRGAPGVYVRLADPFGHACYHPADNPLGNPLQGMGKISALGIKVSRHCAYHGLALNVAMDLEPFSRINPCGYEGLQTVDLSSLGVQASLESVAERVAEKLLGALAPRPGQQTAARPEPQTTAVQG